MPFIPTPIAGALAAINATRVNQEKARDVVQEVPVPVRKERSAFKSLFFGPGR